jgi:hypothetical protein
VNVVERCPGCGRETEKAEIACPGCGRALSRGTMVPPGWGVSATATAAGAAAVTAPRWQLAGLETARPTQGPNDTMPRTPAELFRPPRTGGDATAVQSGGPGWRVRRQGPTLLFTPPAATTVVAAASRTASRFVYWALVGGILASSSAAVFLLAVHMVRAR